MSRTKNRLKKMAVLAVAIIMCFAMTTISAFGYSYTTDSYNVDIIVDEDNTYAVTETISVNFAEEKHGIYRYIPEGSYEELGYMNINDIKVEDYNYEYYSEGGNKVIQIGDGSVYVSGPQKYVISYEVEIYEDRDETRDIFYLDVIPTGWETPIEGTTVSIKFPKKIDKSDIEVYVGGYGSTAKKADVWSYDKSTKTLTIKTEKLSQSTGITVFCELPEGYWQGEASYGWAKPVTIALGVIFPVLIIALWFFFGRDKKIIPTVEFYPPEGMNPAEVGYVMDNSIDKKDLLSLIIYFADKGYISIEEIEKKEFVLTKLKEIDVSEKSFARTLFQGLFMKGDSVNLNDLDEEFGDNYLTAYEQLYGQFSKKKNRQMSLLSGVLQILGIMLVVLAQVVIMILAQWYSGLMLPTLLAGFALFANIIVLVVSIVRADKAHTMKKSSKIFGGAALAILQAAVILLYGYAIATMLEALWLTFVIGVLFYGASIAVANMRQRTKKNIELMGKLVGLKNFIETAEVDRINLLVEENPNYFYNILPYAYVMGLTDKWAKNFETIKLSKPNWYVSTSRDPFDVWVCSRMINNCNSKISKNIKFTTNEDSGRGGGGFSSSGGGFSGGGFGGGGGGSW